MQTAVGALVVGSYWARGELIRPFAEPFRAAASPPHNYSSFFQAWQDLDLYPALRLLYGAGVASALARNWDMLRVLARDVEVVDTTVYRRHSAAYVLDGGYLSRNLATANRTSLVFPEQGYYLPLTEYLYQTLEEPLREYAADRAAYDRAFEEFEVLLSLVSMNVNPERRPESAEPPKGRFVYSRKHGEGETAYERLKAEATEQGSSWGPVAAGLIEADAEMLAVYFQKMDDMIRNRGWR